MKIYALNLFAFASLPVSTSIPREEEKSETQTRFLLHVDDSYSKGNSLSLSIGAEMEVIGSGLGFLLSIFWGIGIFPICVF